MPGLLCFSVTLVGITGCMNENVAFILMPKEVPCRRNGWTGHRGCFRVLMGRELR